MKAIFIAALLLTCNMSANCQTDNPNYDKALADSLGGDDYGMKAYILVILKTGDNDSMPKAIIDSLFNGHMQNIMRMVQAGKLAVSGPMKKNEKNYRGIFILNVKTMEEANALLANDPAIRAHLLLAEMYQWYGSAALPTYLKQHDKIQKKTM